jgi:N-acyl-L-homoserine lactone synthetase
MDLLEYISKDEASECEVSSELAKVVTSRPRNKFTTQLVTDFKSFDQVVTIRRAVFCDECGYDEDNEFDGNDLCAAHILLFADSKPVACARIRFFADFVLLERFSVLPAYRHSLSAQYLSRGCIAYAAAKGYKRVFGVVRDRFVNFWLRMGGFVRKDIEPIMLGSYQYFPVELPIGNRRAAGLDCDVDALLAREADQFLPAPAGLRDAVTMRAPAPMHVSLAH